MEDPMLDFKLQVADDLHDAFYEGYEAGKKDAEYYMTHCGDETPVTNADRIRSMTGEDLAAFLCSLRNGEACGNCLAIDFCSYGHNGFIDWLKRECER